MPNQVLHVHFQEIVETFSLVEGKMRMSTIPNIFFYYCSVIPNAVREEETLISSLIKTFKCCIKYEHVLR